MKIVLSTLLVFMCFMAMPQKYMDYRERLDHQDEFYRSVDWQFYVTDLRQLSDSTYSMTALPIDYNEPGAIDTLFGDMIVDYEGRMYEVIDTTSTTITVYDYQLTGYGPNIYYPVKMIRFAGDGVYPNVSSSDISMLGDQARWRRNGVEHEWLWKHGEQIPYQKFILDTGYVETGEEPVLTRWWNPDDHTTNLKLLNDVVLQDGHEMFFDVQNNTGSTLVNGQVAMVTGTLGNSGKLLAGPGIADLSIITFPEYILGIFTHDIPNGGQGKVTWFGKVRNIQTDGANYGETWVDGNVVYASPFTYGHLTNIAPQAPYPVIPLGVVVHAHNTNGTLFIRPTYPDNLVDLTDVNGTPVTESGQILVWDNDNSWFDFTANINNYVHDSIFDNITGAFRLYGGLIEPNGDGTVRIAAGAGIIKNTEAGPEDVPIAINDGQGGALSYVSWDTVPSLDLIDNAYNYIYLDGSDSTIKTTTDFYSISFTQDFTLGRAYKDAGVVIIRLCGTNAWNFNRRVQLFGEEVFPVLRSSGMFISAVGTLQFAISSGVVWAELVNRFSVGSFDGTTTNFNYWYRDGVGGWTKVSASQIDNANYDDGSGTLASLIPNRYGVHWVFEDHTGAVHVVYGQDSYTQSQAALAPIPNPKPGLIEAYSTIIGKIVIQDGALTFHTIQSAFDETFALQDVPLGNHNDLSGLDGGEPGYYGHITTTERSNWNTAFSWGDHSLAGYLTTFAETDPIYSVSSWFSTTNNASDWDTAFSWGDHSLAGYLTTFTETDPIYSASSWFSTTNNSSNWDETYSWGDHALAGYLTTFTEVDPVFNSHTVSSIVDGSGFLRNNGAGVWTYDNTTYIETELDPVYSASSWFSTTNNASNWDIAFGWGNHATQGYLTSFTETDPIWIADKPNYYTSAQVNALPISTFFNDVGYITEAGSGSGVSFIDTITQTSHGFALDDWIGYLNDQSKFIKCQATTKDSADVIGVVTKVIDANTVEYQFGGIYNGGSYTKGLNYFLSSTSAGDVTTTDEWNEGDVRLFLGTGVDNGFLIEIALGDEFTVVEYADVDTLEYYLPISGGNITGNLTIQTNQIWHAGIFANNSANWNTAFSWGDHASQGYLTSYTETDPIYSASSWFGTTNNASNWNTAYTHSQVTTGNPHNINATDISDLDTEISNNSSVVANTAKVTNATHTGDVSGSTTLTIQDNAVDPQDLNATNEPTVGYVPTYANDGSFTWAEGGSGGSGGDGEVFFGVSAYATAGQAHVEDGDIALPNEHYDTHDLHDNVTNNSRLTASDTAYYLINVSIRLALNTSNDQIQVNLKKNGVIIHTWHSSQDESWDTSDEFSFAAPYVAYLLPNDYITISMGDPGGSISGTHYTSTYLQMNRMGVKGETGATGAAGIAGDIVQTVSNGSKTSSFTHKADSASMGNYDVNTTSGITVSIHNLESGMMGTIFLDIDGTNVPSSISISGYSDAGTTLLTKREMNTISFSAGKMFIVTYVCASDGTNLDFIIEYSVEQ